MPERDTGPYGNDLRSFLDAYKAGFGGGMIPFDTAYHRALEAGATPAEAQLQGGQALLSAFVTLFEAGEHLQWIDAEGMPVDDPQYWNLDSANTP